MRKIMVGMVAVLLLWSAGLVMAQQESQTTPTAQTQPQTGMMDSEGMPQMMKQMTDNMQRVQQVLASGKLGAADMKKMQDMFNQMQVILDQMGRHMMHMMHPGQKCCQMKACPMMKEMRPQPQPQTPPEATKPPETRRKRNNKSRRGGTADSGKRAGDLRFLPSSA